MARISSKQKQERIEMHQRAIEFIEVARSSFPGSVEVYNNGACFKFALMLDVVLFGKGQICYDGDHACYEMFEKHYDITGQIEVSSRMLPLTETHSIYQIHKLLN